MKKQIRFSSIKIAFFKLKECCMTAVAIEVFFNLEGKMWELFI